MIIISNPIAVANEINLIHSLFEKGMELFHVRKPSFSEEEMKAFVTAIGLEYKDKLVLHSYHHLAEEFGINQLHFTEKNRIAIAASPAKFTKSCRFSLKEYKKEGLTFSTSTHSIATFNTLSNDFDYAFLSPVFPSISKENYVPKTDLFKEIKKRTNFDTKLVALGGIKSQHIKKTLDAGFDNVALLGTIWNSEKPIKNFILCQQIVHSF